MNIFFFIGTGKKVWEGKWTFLLNKQANIPIIMQVSMMKYSQEVSSKNFGIFDLILFETLFSLGQWSNLAILGAEVGFFLILLIFHNKIGIFPYERSNFFEDPI